MPPGWDQYAKTFAEGFFPLKMETIRSGKREVVLEVKHLEKKALADSLFAPPAGFSEIKLPNLGGR